MARQGDEVFDPVTRTRIVFVCVPGDKDGRESAVGRFVLPCESLPTAAHYHLGPHRAVAERFEIITGMAKSQVGTRSVTVAAPDAIVIGLNQKAQGRV